MKVVGSILITANRQKTIKEGARWDIPRQHFKAATLRRARVGDLVWLREPFTEFTNHASLGRHIFEVVRGNSPLVAKTPKHILPYRDRCHRRILPASAMDRVGSLACIEITAIGAKALGCIVHDQQVDEFLKARRAA